VKDLTRAGEAQILHLRALLAPPVQDDRDGSREGGIERSPLGTYRAPVDGLLGNTRHFVRVSGLRVENWLLTGSV
jgi:hypothetical protein